ncbi:MAG TPA: hypothetical protein VL484_14915 [Vicinamibacterales bacterium]|nr:hypothetical protein [Vicinamibacterales bacterium]
MLGLTSSSSRTAAVLTFALAAILPSIASAQQQQEPIGMFAADVRGVFARHKQEPSVATDLNVTPANLPTRSFGFAAGAQVYPVHAGKVTLGFGAHFVVARGSETLEPPPPGTSTGTMPSTVTYGTVRRHFTSFAPEVSLNFGHKNGWSYISGGLGRSKLYLDRADIPASGTPGRQTINYGAGARWFNTHHLAFSVDVRWYSVAEQLATATVVAQPRTTLLVLSGGISLK